MDTAYLKKCTRHWLHHTEPLQHSHMATCCHEEHHWCSLLAAKDFYPTLPALVPWFMACTHGASKNLDNAALPNATLQAQGQPPLRSCTRPQTTFTVVTTAVLKAENKTHRLHTVQRPCNPLA